MNLDKLVNYICANGPITLTEAMKALDMGSYGKTMYALASRKAQKGGIDYCHKTKKWSRVVVKVEPRTPYVWRDLRVDLYAQARLRPGAMDYRDIPSVWG